MEFVHSFESFSHHLYRILAYIHTIIFFWFWRTMKSAELLKIGKGRVQISVSHNFTSFKRSITLHFTTFWSVSCGVIFPSFDSYVWLPRKKAFLGAMNINNRKGRKIPTCISLVSYLLGEKMMRKYCGCHCGLLFHKYVYTWESISSDILQNVVFFS